MWNSSNLLFKLYHGVDLLDSAKTQLIMDEFVHVVEFLVHTST